MALKVGSYLKNGHATGTPSAASPVSLDDPGYVSSTQTYQPTTKPAAETPAPTTNQGSSAGGSVKATTPAPVAKSSGSSGSSSTGSSTGSSSGGGSTGSGGSGTSDIATEAQCPGQSDVANTVSALVCMTNFARNFHSLNSVSSNASLMASSADKAQDIKNCGFSHTACGQTFNYYFGVEGYTGGCQAENIAMGQLTPTEVFTAWMNSAGHRANILNGTYTNIGVASLNSSNGIIWVMHLGAHC